MRAACSIDMQCGGWVRARLLALHEAFDSLLQQRRPVLARCAQPAHLEVPACARSIARVVRLRACACALEQGWRSGAREGTGVQHSLLRAVPVAALQHDLLGRLVVPKTQRRSTAALGRPCPHRSPHIGSFFSSAICSASRRFCCLLFSLQISTCARTRRSPRGQRFRPASSRTVRAVPRRRCVWFQARRRSQKKGLSAMPGETVALSAQRSAANCPRTHRAHRMLQRREHAVCRALHGRRASHVAVPAHSLLCRVL